MFLYFCLLGSFSSWMQGPLHSLLGWLGWPSAQSARRVLGGDCGRAARSDLWGHDLGWCASGKIQLLLSESSRRKWWIWGIGRTGHLLALWSLLALQSHAVEVPSLHPSCRGHAGWLSAWSLVQRGSLLSSESYMVVSGVSMLETARKEEENNMNLNLHACQPLTQ